MALWECSLCQAQVAGQDDSVAWLGWRRIVHEADVPDSSVPRVEGKGRPTSAAQLLTLLRTMRRRAPRRR
jgi:hypothetical protein